MSEQGGEASGPAGLTDYELAALVDLNPTPQGLRALEAIGVAGLLDDPGALRAGVASLLVRGLAEAEDDRLLVGGFAGAVGTMLATADDLLLLVVTRAGEVAGRTVLVDAPAGGFLLDMTSLGAHVVQPLGLDTDLADLVRAVIAEFAEDAAGLPFDVTLSRFHLDGDVRTAGLTVAGPHAWHAHGTNARTAPLAWSEVLLQLGPSDAEAASTPRRAVDPNA
nr:hypothetical protein [Propionibacterium sp.]